MLSTEKTHKKAYLSTHSLTYNRNQLMLIHFRYAIESELDVSVTSSKSVSFPPRPFFSVLVSDTNQKVWIRTSSNVKASRSQRDVETDYKELTNF